MEASPKVRRIEPTRPLIHGAFSTNTPVKRRVAAYARVSTDSDEQFTSFEAQVAYYTKQIEERPEWSMVRVYADADAPYGQNAKRP